MATITYTSSLIPSTTVTTATTTDAIYYSPNTTTYSSQNIFISGSSRNKAKRVNCPVIARDVEDDDGI